MACDELCEVFLAAAGAFRKNERSWDLVTYIRHGEVFPAAAGVFSRQKMTSPWVLTCIGLGDVFPTATGVLVFRQTITFLAFL